MALRDIFLSKKRTTTQRLMAGSGAGLKASLGLFDGITSLAQMETTTMGPRGAMRMVAFYECVKELSEGIASMSRHWYKVDHDGPYLGYDQYDLWKYKLHPHLTSFKVIRTWVMHYLLYGNGYLIIRRKKGRPAYYEVCDTIEPFIDSAGTLWYYNYATADIYYHYDVLHLADLGVNPYKGLSKATQHALTLGKGLAADTLANKIYTNGTFLGAVIEYPETVDMKEPQMTAVLQSFKKHFSGVNGAGKVGGLSRGGKYNQLKLDMPLADSEYIQNAKMTTDDIRAIFNMPPKEGNAYNSLEQKKIEILQKAMLPIIIMIEEEVNSKVVRPSEVGQVYLEHKYESYLRADSKSRMEFYKGMVQISALTINEVRALENMPSIEGGDVPMYAANNMLPLTMAGDYGEALIAKLLQGTNRRY